MSLLALCVIVLGAFTTEAAVGFGSTVLTVALGAHLYPIDRLLAAFVPVNLALSTWIVLRNRRAVDGGLLLRRVLPAVALGLLPGMYLFRAQHAHLLRLGFALFVVVLAALELGRMLATRSTAAPAPLGRAAATGLLAAGGLVHGLFGSGGPLVVYVASRLIADKAVFRATLSTLWLVLNLALVLNYASLGRLTPASAAMSLALVAPLLVALRLGDWLHGRIAPGPFRVFIYVLLLVAGLALAARSL